MLWRSKARKIAELSDELLAASVRAAAAEAENRLLKESLAHAQEEAKRAVNFITFGLTGSRLWEDPETAKAKPEPEEKVIEGNDMRASLAEQQKIEDAAFEGWVQDERKQVMKDLGL